MGQDQSLAQQGSGIDDQMENTCKKRRLLNLLLLLQIFT